MVVNKEMLCLFCAYLLFWSKDDKLFVNFIFKLYAKSLFVRKFGRLKVFLSRITY